MATKKSTTTTKKTTAAKKPSTAAKKPSTTAKKPAAAAAATDALNVGSLVETVVTKLKGDSGLLEKFKTNALAVVKKLLPNIKDKDILNTIIQAVSAKLNLGNLLGALGGTSQAKPSGQKPSNGKDDKDGGLLGSITGLFTGK